MGDIYENIEEYNPAKKQKILIVFDNMAADMLGNIKLNPIATELFIRCRKLLFLLDKLILPYENIMLNSTNFSFMKIPNR